MTSDNTPGGVHRHYVWVAEQKSPAGLLSPPPIEIKPCPFCGAKNNSPVEGSTSRWIAIECAECGARSGEVRRTKYTGDMLHEDSMEAYEEWNKRAPK